MWKWRVVASRRRVAALNSNDSSLLSRCDDRNPQKVFSRAYSSIAPPPAQPPCGFQSVAVESSIFSAVNHYSLCYWQLAKARLSMLVVATSGTGFILGTSASWTAINTSALVWTCAGTMMVASAAGTLNQVFESTNDAKMKRTRSRPLPSGRITAPHAITFASLLALSGTSILAYKANILTAGLAASNLVLYSFVYTPLKQIHPINTWVGAIVGAIPPLLGWTAACGELSLNSLILPAALYYWQIPHFMALAFFCREDYASGGFKMLSLNDISGRKTAVVALRNCLYLLPLGYLAYHLGMTSGWFAVEASVLTVAIGSSAYMFYRQRSKNSARRMFYASLLYLPVFMSGLLLHRQIGDQDRATLDDEESHVVVDDLSEEKKRCPGRAPVAYASVAPFPFLPAPTYAVC